LIVLYDDNHISIDGPTSLADSTDSRARFAAAGWRTDACNGQDAEDVRRALDDAQSSDRPVMIACRTTIGFGAPTKAGTNKAHSDALGDAEIAGARKILEWPFPPFEIPDEILSGWRAIGSRGKTAREAWEQRKRDAKAETRAGFEAALGALPASLSDAIVALKQKLSADKPEIATRKASELALDVINPIVSTTIGGSADLTGSNNTRSKEMKEITPDDFTGRYIHYGVREHGMVAAMNGMALHGGVIPYGGTFLVFSDYCRPSIRLAAIMGQRVILVMTHDSIGLGEDGPTHQPVEQIAAMRAMPNLLVFRPADAVETAECWELALARTEGPSLLALSRQNLPTFREKHVKENLSAKGAYEIEPAGGAKVTFLATGSEVALARAARDLLAKENIAARIVSMPCWALFDAQPEAARNAVLGNTPVRVAVEAAAPLGWERYLRPGDAFLGMNSFGASGSYKDVYKHFGITAEAAAQLARDALKRAG
ncbi:MAG: transketolase, partial [Alphaproteobacteria bacterium]|nr:transketolase [Alphaproteobacteria bacterium]